jgi:hypothetical protein
MKRASLAIGAVAALIASSAAFAPQDQWVQQVRRMLQQASERYAEQGYVMSHDIYTGSLNDDARESVALVLDGGKEYQLMGACDTDCDDLDMVIFDPSGNEVDSDVLDDDFPIVSATVGRTGRYRVEVRMPGCNRQPCRYGIGVFAK